MDRWATFDCYGTLIDWNAGIRAELDRVFAAGAGPPPRRGGREQESGEGADAAVLAAQAESDERLARYHELERELERDGSRSYRDVMTEVMRRLGAPEAEADSLAESLPRWQPFTEVRPALEDLRGRGWKLAILSNSDADLIAASKELLGVPFEETVVASEIRSYKPALAHWTEFYVRTLADRRRHVHVGASLYHDIAPATRLRLPTIWINRLDEHPGPAPTVELPDLEGLPEALEELMA